jgi:medium-chain acyl-[acyl-carrier-protein] hydrolase
MDHQSELNSRWFEHLSPGKSTGLCLFCFPYAGGSANVFRSWQRHFVSEVDLCLVHLPGRGRRIGEPPFTSMNALVDAIADQIHQELRCPYAFYGHSMGAVIGFELARVLRLRHGTEPAALFLSGRRAPRVPRSTPASFDLPDEQFIAELRRLNGTPAEVLQDSNLLELFLPLLRADFQVSEAYQYQTGNRLSCPMTVYGGLRDVVASVQDLQKWQEHTTAAFQLRLFPGGHFFIQEPNNSDFLKTFGQDVSAVLDTLLAGARVAQRINPGNNKDEKRVFNV